MFIVVTLVQVQQAPQLTTGSTRAIPKHGRGSPMGSLNCSVTYTPHIFSRKTLS
ncbi:18145_t:CDS:1, partial [Dentiscutata erythropus]